MYWSLHKTLIFNFLMALNSSMYNQSYQRVL